MIEIPIGTGIVIFGLLYILNSLVSAGVGFRIQQRRIEADKAEHYELLASQERQAERLVKLRRREGYHPTYEELHPGMADHPGSPLPREPDEPSA